MDRITVWLNQHITSLTPVLMTIVLLIGASVVMVLLKRPLRIWLKRVEARLHLPHVTVLTIKRVATSALWAIVVMLILELWGISVGGLWTLLVSAAAVIGVGFLVTWTMVSNIYCQLLYCALATLPPR
jgi:hypothetical protein